MLPDGGVVTAGGEVVLRPNSAGVVTHTYTLERWSDLGAIALADGGRTFWVTQTRCVRTADQVDLDTGALIRSQPLSMDDPRAIVPWGAWTAAISAGGPAAVAGVPASSTYALLALAAVIAVAAIRRIG